MKFLVRYTMELPGWDEYGIIRHGEKIIIAESLKDAEEKFESTNKYCFVDMIIKLND